MLSNYVLPGDKVELKKIQKRNSTEEASENKTYFSKVNEILTEDTLEIMMPLEQTKLVLLSLEQEFDLYFHATAGMFQCRAVVVDRYKTNNIYLVVLELTSSLKKHQRREYYRYGCAIQAETRPLEKEELTAAEKKQKLILPDLPFQKSIIADISGGGARFLTQSFYEVGSKVYCKCMLTINGNAKEFYLLGEVLYNKKIENKEELYEHRIQYRNIQASEREEIIRFIFEEERKNRKRETGI